MKNTRIIARLLFYNCRLFACFYLITAAYASFVLAFAKKGSGNWLPARINTDRFEIYYPFTEKPFLIGDYSENYIMVTMFVTWGYGIFLWLLSGVFNVFRKQKLFSIQSVNALRIFYLFNFIVPVIISIILVVAGIEINDMLVIVFLHFIIGVFAYFMAAIFKQGLLLQEEQDLTL